jgi:CheY-like chemotaxis protein
MNRCSEQGFMKVAGGAVSDQRPRAHRVLVVDDNRDAADSLALLLSVSGYDTMAAYDGAEAVGVAAKFRPDLALMDIHMPVLDGYHAANQLRQLLAGSIVLVAITAIGTPESSSKARGAGFDLQLRKPMDPRALCELVDEILIPAR